MSYRSTLPMAKNKELLKQYTDALENFKKYRDSLKASLQDLVEEDITDLEEKVEYYRVKCLLDELEAKINVQEYHKDLYQARIDEYQPKFEADSTEANEHWLSVWNEAKGLAEKNPLSTIALIVNGYPEKAEQELKNETYKALKNQIAHMKEEKKKSYT